MIESHAAPAGWYPEPSGAEGQRWWDGSRWTEYATPLAAPTPAAGQYAPYEGGAERRVPAGTPVDTVWIWLIVAAPLLAVIPLFLWDFEGYMLTSMTDPDPTAQLRMYLDPMYLTSVVLGWLLYGVSVWFAYLDRVALERLGYARRFHWAWAFLSSLVYVIGRSVVVKKQAGRGAAPMWVAIALNVAMMIALFIWVGVATANVLGAVVTQYPGV
ncbi:DUF2510 domain-containing protein [Agromyces ramosus]|uniref:DUF2510 domain-containing protein n=1 Tax=Agromyces ramosus TaxID=33879 RepID=A0ABU0R5J5_9MICO|nr:DUF2510 domain-containing protein [Agromyces ramosus]MDQ0893353.1 hypothetical protein [Agromyces ramosus]